MRPGPGQRRPEPSGEEPPQLDVARLLEALGRHGAQYVVVGGAGARGHGATRDTVDLDCVVRQDRENLDNVAAALRDLGAFLRVGGMSDEEARRLPVQVDARTPWRGSPPGGP